jgi:hypothetical protein
MRPGTKAGAGGDEEVHLMKRRSMGVRALGLLGLTLAVSGCGGGGHAAKTATTATTGSGGPAKAQFIAQADNICRGLRTSLAQFQAQTKSLTALGDTPKAFGLAATLFRRVQSIEQGELSRLRALPLPSGDTSAVTNYFEQGAKSVALIGSLADAFAKGDKTAIANIERDGSRISATAKGLAQGYGFKVCGNGTGGNGLS